MCPFMKLRSQHQETLKNQNFTDPLEAILIGFLHIFVSTGYPISHKIIQKRQFMQTALALQNHSESFFPASTQSPEISSLATFLSY